MTGKYDSRSPGRRVLRRALVCAALAFLASPARAEPVPAEERWVTQPTPAYPKKRDDIVFASRTTGFYGTGRGHVYRTQDGGRTWQQVAHLPGAFVRSLGFIDEKHGFLGNLGVGLAGTTDANALYETRDAGTTWQPIDLGTAAIAGICSIDIVRARAIVEGEIRERIVIHAAGRANGPAQLLRSEDGGSSWTYHDLSSQAGMILDVKFVDPNVGYVFAGSSSDVSQSHALILRTVDGGRSWREIYRSARAQELIWKASSPAPGVLYATIQNNDPANLVQRFVKSVDGGKTWAEGEIVRDGAATLFGVGFVDRKRGWVGTAKGGFATADGGRHWSRSPLAPSANKIRTAASDGTPMVYSIGTEVQMLGGTR